MSSSPEFLSCQLCSASFRRHDHLRRHLASHQPDRPHRCSFCEGSFKRRDVLRKHLKACSIRLERGVPMPEREPTGKKIRACDACAKTKRSCDGNEPCSTCSAKDVLCSYERVPGLKQKSLPTPSEFEFEDCGFDTSLSVINDTDFAWVEWDDSFLSSLPHQIDAPSFDPSSLLEPAHEASREVSKMSFEFLLNFTNSSSMKHVFKYRRRRSHCDALLEIPTTFGGCEALPYSSMGKERSHSGLTPFHHSTPSQSSWIESNSDAGSQVSDLCQIASSGVQRMVQWLDDPLFPQTKQLWDTFRNLVSFQMKMGAIEDVRKTDARCLEFFSPPNIRRFIVLFFDEWYPHCPIIHKPTFDISQTPLILLAPMIIIGACMSPLDKDVEDARAWIDLAETFVFSAAILSIEATERDNREVDIEPYKVIQAGYLICLLQNWEGNETVKRRVRHHRFTAVIAAAREIGISNANHVGQLGEPLDQFDWDIFIRKEEAIRTFTYVFLLDTAFVIFNNRPPQMCLHEMELDLTYPEICFQAETAEDCYKLLQPSSQTQRLSNKWMLSTTIEALAASEFDSSTAFVFGSMSTLNLFAIISGLHTVLFQQRTLLICLPQSLQPFDDALDRWDTAWNSIPENSSDWQPVEPWQETGFFCRGHEYSLLARAELTSLRQGQSKNARGKLDDSSMSYVNELMLNLTVGGG